MTRREVLLLATSLAPGAAISQAQFRSQVREVHLQVTVRDQQGKLVRGLQHTDFEISEEGRDQKIRYFEREGSPLSVGVLFDVSGSQREVLAEQTAAGLKFLEQTLRPEDQGFVAGFDRGYVLAQALTESRDALEAGLRGLHVGGDNSQGTALFDAIVRASEGVGTRGGKAFVLLTDGQDTASAASLKDAIAAAQRADVVLYPIWVYDREVFKFRVASQAEANLERGRNILERMAKETGGRMLEIADDATLAQDFAAIEEELRARYSMGYSQPRGAAGYRKIRVKVKGKGLRVQAREGYYAAEEVPSNEPVF